jgi:hypothetical protein
VLTGFLPNSWLTRADTVVLPHNIGQALLFKVLLLLDIILDVQGS